jgi:hypothetical protein
MENPSSTHYLPVYANSEVKPDAQPSSSEYYINTDSLVQLRPKEA